jgi:hypothetical protein
LRKGKINNITYNLSAGSNPKPLSKRRPKTANKTVLRPVLKDTKGKIIRKI